MGLIQDDWYLRMDIREMDDRQLKDLRKEIIKLQEQLDKANRVIEMYHAALNAVAPHAAQMIEATVEQALGP